MKHAKLILKFKRKAVFDLTAFMIVWQFKEVLNKELEGNEKEIKKKLNRIGKLKQSLTDLVNVIENYMGDAIREGRVNVFFDQDGDRTITFEMEGTEEEIEKWTQIKRNQKLALKTYLKPVMKVEVKE